MDDFFKKIRGAVQDMPLEGASEQSWRSFELFREKKEKGSGLPFPWLIASMGLLLPLLGIGIYMASSTVEPSHSEVVQTIIIRDTIYIESEHEAMVKLSDTVYQSIQRKLNESKTDLDEALYRCKILQQKINSTNSLVQDFGSKFSSQAQQIASLHSALQVFQELSSLRPLPFVGNSAGDTANAYDESLYFPSLAARALGDISFMRERLHHPSTILWISNKEPFRLLNLIRPKTLTLNVNAGIQQTNIDPIYSANGVTGSVNISTLFSKNLRGYLGIAGSKHVSEIKDWEDYPNVPSVSIGEEEFLKELKIHKSEISLITGLEYMINTSSYWRPFFGAGWGYAMAHRDMFAFEADGPAGERYINAEETVSQSSYHSWLLTAGTDIDISRTIDLRLGMTYIRGGGTLNQNAINLQVGAYYHF